MSRLVLSQITIKKERSISSTTWYYLLQPSNASAPDSTNYGNPPPIYSDTGYSGWSTTEPTYTIGDDRVLYTMVQTLYSDNTFTYSTPTISSSYEAAKDAYSEAVQAEQDILELQELGLASGYIWDNMTYVAPTSTIPVYPIGSYIASGTLVNGSRTITRSNSNTYGLNTWISTGGINLRYNAIDLMKLTTSNLEFYYPSTSSQGTKAISLGTNGAINSLVFYGFNNSNKTMELTNNALKFYNPADGSTLLSSLTSDGLILSKGGIVVGSYNSSASDANQNFVYLSSQDYGTGIQIGNSPSDKTDWRQIIGNKFGVDKAGNLYASNATISGAINADSGSVGGWSIEPHSISKVSAVTSGTATTQYQTSLYAPSLISASTKGLYFRKRSYDGSRYGGWADNCYIRYDGYIYAIGGGRIGAWKLGTGTSGALSNGKTSLSETTNNGVWIGTDGIALGKGTFKVTNAGALTATSGTIGGWYIGANSIYSGHDTEATAKSGTTSGDIALSTADFTRTINNVSRDGLRFAIGANFGVKNDGTLYAKDAIIYGAITATSLTIGSGATVSGLSTSNISGINNYATVTAAQGYANDASYLVEIEVRDVNYTTPTATLFAHVYYKGGELTSSTSPAISSIGFQWKKVVVNSGTYSVTDISNATNQSLVTSDLDTTYICVISNNS